MGTLAEKARAAGRLRTTLNRYKRELENKREKVAEKAFAALSDCGLDPQDLETEGLLTLAKELGALDVPLKSDPDPEPEPDDSPGHSSTLSRDGVTESELVHTADDDEFVIDDADTGGI